MHVKAVYLPFWQGTVPKYEWYSFAKLKAAAQRNGTKLIRIFAKPVTIKLAHNDQIMLTPLEDRITTKTMDYPAVHLTYTIQGSTQDLYSVKYKKKDVSVIEKIENTNTLE